MTVEEIFSGLATHLQQGIEMHNQFVQMYDFLGFKFYGRRQYEQYLEEINNCHSLCHYYMKHYHKLIIFKEAKAQNVIPASWYRYTQLDVDMNTKRNAVKDINQQWISWEKSTKEYITQLHKQLMDLGELAAALYFEKMLKRVDKELAHAETFFLELETVGYDLVHMVEEQYKAGDIE